MQCGQAFVHRGNAPFTTDGQRHQIRVRYLAVPQDPLGGYIFEAEIVGPEFMVGQSADGNHYAPSSTCFDVPTKPQLESD